MNIFIALCCAFVVCCVIICVPNLIYQPEEYIMIEKILITCASLGLFAIVLAEVVRSL